MKDKKAIILEDEASAILLEECKKHSGYLLEHMGGYTNNIDLCLYTPEMKKIGIDVKSLKSRTFESTLKNENNIVDLSPNSKLTKTRRIENFINALKPSDFPNNTREFITLNIPLSLTKDFILEHCFQHGIQYIMLKFKVGWRVVTIEEFVENIDIELKGRRKKSGSSVFPKKHKESFDKILKVTYPNSQISLCKSARKNRLITKIDEPLIKTSFLMSLPNKQGEDEIYKIILSEPASSDVIKYGLKENEYFINKTSNNSSCTTTMLISVDKNKAIGETIDYLFKENIN